LPSRANQRLDYSGIDSLEDCLDKKHFKSYPYKIKYEYNSRGFRDLEWPDSVDELKRSVWCVGDSFTVGLGQPFSHTWPQVLAQKLGRNTINISMDGASNQWIARKSVKLINDISPHVIIIHWSYFHRRECEALQAVNNTWNKIYNTIRDPSWPDCYQLAEFQQLPSYIKVEILQQHKLDAAIYCAVHDMEHLDYYVDELRRLHFERWHSDQDNYVDIVNCISNVMNHCKNTTVVHSFIPKACDDNFKSIQNFLDCNQLLYVPEFLKLDFARDGHHYDVVTARYFVDKIIDVLE